MPSNNPGKRSLKNILVVGVGFSGVTIARELADSGLNITVI